jgi:protein phosphatase
MEALPAGVRSQVTRALGVAQDVEAEIVEHELRAGDLLLLCSDGLNDLVGDGDIEQTLINLCQNLPLAADQLIEMANERGGRDNVSVILIGVQGEEAPVAGVWQQFLARVG